MAQKPNEQVQGITADPVRKTYWVYTDQAILELEHKNEDRDIWKIYLEKGRYDSALQYAKVTKIASASSLTLNSCYCRPRSNETPS